MRTTPRDPSATTTKPIGMPIWLMMANIIIPIEGLCATEPEDVQSYTPTKVIGPAVWVKVRGYTELPVSCQFSNVQLP